VVHTKQRGQVCPSESVGIMGHLEFYNETTGEWTNLEDVPMFDTINCQLCNEPTEAHDIVAEIKFKDDQPVVGAWQCRKCKAVNG
jgi:hypothetical protein